MDYMETKALPMRLGTIGTDAGQVMVPHEALAEAHNTILALQHEILVLKAEAAKLDASYAEATKRLDFLALEMKADTLDPASMRQMQVYECGSIRAADIGGAVFHWHTPAEGVEDPTSLPEPAPKADPFGDALKRSLDERGGW